MNKTSISDENKTDLNLIQKEGIDVLNFAAINYIDKCECGIENGGGIVIPKWYTLCTYVCTYMYRWYLII